MKVKKALTSKVSAFFFATVTLFLFGTLDI